MLGLVLFGLLSRPATAHARTCEVAFRLDDPVTVGAFQFDVDYSAATGSFLTGPGGAACSGDAANALAIFQDAPANRVLTASLLSLAGVVGPQKVAHCFFEDTDGTLVATDFVTTVVDASDPDGQPVMNTHVSVLLPDCGDETTTTTTTSTSTTTTMPDPCGNGVVDGLEQCDDGNTQPDDGCEPDCSTDVVCGDANGNDAVQTGDALLVLRAAIGQSVDCPDYLCDADGDLQLLTRDALRVLRRAVGQSIVMSCPLP